jgi:hypothetical protein
VATVATTRPGDLPDELSLSKARSVLRRETPGLDCARNSESLDSDALCQITRLVDVASHGEGGVVRHDLQWDT